MTREFLNDIKARSNGVPVNQRINSLGKCLKSLGVAIVLPLAAAMPQAQASNIDVDTVEEAREAGKKLAENMFAGAFADWQKRQQEKEEKQPKAEPGKPATSSKPVATYSASDFARANCEFYNATSTSPAEQQKAGGTNAALRATITDFNDWRKGKNTDLPTADAEFIKIYQEKEKSLQSDPAFNAVIRERADKLALPTTNNQDAWLSR